MTNEDRSEVFRGHFYECFEHFSQCLASKVPKGMKGASDAKRPIAEFCGVGVQTVSDWLASRAMIVGRSQLKLMFYLDLIGYRVIELERMSKMRRNFAELIGYGLLTVEEASQELGYSKSWKIFDLLRGKPNPQTAEKDQKMWDLWKARKEELEVRKEQLRIAHQRDILPETAPAVEALTVAPSLPQLRVLSARRPAGIRFMQGLSELLEDPEYAKPSDDMLARLRLDQQVVLRLTAQMNSLSSALLANGRKDG